MSKRSFFVYVTAVIAAAIIGVSALVFPALATAITEQTLSSESVTVVGEFEEGAVLTVSTTLYSEQAVLELIERKQIRKDKQIVAIYDIAVSGEQAVLPEYHITITGVKLSPLAKNYVSVIDANGAYFSISDFNYNNDSISFNSDTLGQYVIYRDMTLFYVIAGVCAGIIVFVIALKIIERKRFKEQKEGKNRNKHIREHDKKYHW